MPANVPADVTGTVWEVVAEAGSQVAEGDTLMLIESMKMEIPVAAPRAGRVVEILLAKGDKVEEGQTVAVLE